MKEGKLTEGDLNLICRKEGLNQFDPFVRWFKRRFGLEVHSSYVKEWIERFKSGFPIGYMDEKSQQVWKEVLSEYSEVF